MSFKPRLIRLVHIRQRMFIDGLARELVFSRGPKVISNDGLGIIAASDIQIGPFPWPLPTVAVPVHDLSARSDPVSSVCDRDLQIVYTSSA
jgi:hypothetical protein